MAGGLAEVLGEVLVAADGEEVAVAALAARGVSLVGLYFGCSLSGPCAQLGASLAAFYGRFRGEAAAAGAQRLEIVFVSAEQEQQQWQEAVRAMPWLALPFADKHRKVRPRRGCGEGFVGAGGGAAPWGGSRRALSRWG
uniref:Thioredoxin-like fold domain-containing protein n=1 Tax=Cairina moschata TaxID=8855 RepID=A0A8C3CKW9_CAIMO